MAAPRIRRRFEWLLIGFILLVIITVFFTFRAPDSKPGIPNGGDLEHFPLQIIQVQVRLMESLPVQGIADVKGIIPDACSSALEPEITRSGNTITIRIIGERPRDRACAQVIRDYQRNIQLGALQSGDYVLHVNDVTTSFHVS